MSYSSLYHKLTTIYIMRNLKLFETLEEYNQALESGLISEGANLYQVRENAEMYIHRKYSNLIAPKYFGLVSPSTTTVTEDLIKSVTMIEKPHYQYTTSEIIDPSLRKALYAYPYTNKLVEILDHSGFSYIESFDSGTILIGETTYTWYLLKDEADLSGIIFKFL